MHLKRNSIYNSQKKRYPSQYVGAALILVIALVFIGYARIVFSSPFIVEDVAKIIDGDTIHIHIWKMRLAGIDAPEISQKCKYLNANWDCGISAKNSLIAKIDDKPIRCELHNKDRYNRFVATCFLGEEDLNEWLVLNGYAVAYTQYSEKYRGVEMIAQNLKKGIWSASFQMPAEFRKAKRNNKTNQYKTKK